MQLSQRARGQSADGYYKCSKAAVLCTYITINFKLLELRASLVRVEQKRGGGHQCCDGGASPPIIIVKLLVFVDIVTRH